jgi:hypothetical protein
LPEIERDRKRRAVAAMTAAIKAADDGAPADRENGLRRLDELRREPWARGIASDGRIPRGAATSNRSHLPSREARR